MLNVLHIWLIAEVHTCPIVTGVHTFPIVMEADAFTIVTTVHFPYCPRNSIYTTIAALCAKSVLKIGQISTCTVSILLQSSRNFFYAFILPVRNLWTARFCICPLFFTIKNQKQFRIATVAIFRSDLYAGVFPQMSPPLYGGGDINR